MSRRWILSLLVMIFGVTSQLQANPTFSAKYGMKCGAVTM